MIDIFGSFSDSLETLLTTLASSLPRLIFAMAVFVVGLLLADMARRAVFNAISRRRHGNRISVGLAQVVFVCVTILAGFVSLAILGLDAGSLVAGLGLTSLAIGFALRDIIENSTAGILLSFSQPYSIGDWIRVGTEEGEVVDITVRATIIRTADGTDVYLPNRMVYTGIVENKTAYPERRFSVELPVPPGTDIRTACAVSIRAAQQVTGVLTAPGADAQVLMDAASTGRVRVFFWANTRTVPLHLYAEVMAAVQAELEALPKPQQ